MHVIYPKMQEKKKLTHVARGIDESEQIFVKAMLHIKIKAKA